MTDKMLTIPEAAEMVGCHRATLVRMIHRGELKALRLGRQYRIKASDLEPKYVQVEEREPTPREPVGKFSRLASELARTGGRSGRA